MPDSSAFIIALFAVGLVAMCIELVIPGVIVGLFGAGCALTAVFMAYAREPNTLGHVLLTCLILFLPVLLWLWFHVLSRFVTLQTRQEAKVSSEEEKSLVGKQGVTLTKLRPSGAARIDEERVDVVARGEVIEVGVRVEVIAVEGNRVVVRAVRG